MRVAGDAAFTWPCVPGAAIAFTATVGVRMGVFVVEGAAGNGSLACGTKVGRCRLQIASIKTRLESAPGVCNQRLKLKRVEPLSNVGFKFNQHRYTKAQRDGAPKATVSVAIAGRVAVDGVVLTVGRRTLSV
jgi:hypothetical protein